MREPILRKDGYWAIQWRTDGKRISIVCKDKEECLKRAKRKGLDEELQRQETQDRITTFEEYFQTMMETHKVGLAANTKKNYMFLSKQYIMPFIGERFLLTLKRLDGQKIVADMIEQGLSLNTVRRVASILSMTMELAVDDNLIPLNCFRRLRIPRNTAITPIKEPFTSDELKAIFKVAFSREDMAKSNVAYAVAAYLMAETGMRKEEALGLEWANIDIQHRTISIVRTVVNIGKVVINPCAKNPSSNRTIPISNLALGMMYALDRNGTFVFHSKYGTPLNPLNLNRSWARWCSEADVAYRSPHTLRHTFITNMIDMGASVESIKALTGHSTNRMIDHYSHPVHDSVLAAASAQQSLMKKLISF